MSDVKKYLVQQSRPDVWVERRFEQSAIRRGRMAVDPFWYVCWDNGGKERRFPTKRDCIAAATTLIEGGRIHEWYCKLQPEHDGTCHDGKL